MRITTSVLALLLVISDDHHGFSRLTSTMYVCFSVEK